MSTKVRSTNHASTAPVPRKPREPSLRALTAERLRDARLSANVAQKRIAEYWFIRELIRPKNKEREEYAQLFKNEKYEGLSSLQATELFASKIREAAIRHRARHMKTEEEAARGLLNPDLAMNSNDTINDVWHGRQIADMSGLDYAEYADKVVGQYVARDAWRRPPSPRDLRSESAYRIAEAEEARAERCRKGCALS